MRKALVTGIGMVSPFGSGADAYWKGMLGEPVRAGEGFRELGERLPNKMMYLCPPSGSSASELSLRAVSEALADAGIAAGSVSGAGVAVGTTMGDEAGLEAGRDAGADVPEFPFQIGSAIASLFGCEGPNYTVSNACTSGLYAIDLAVDAIRSGEAEIMIAGGVEAASRIVMGCFNRMGALDRESCRPFDVDRKGTVLGEGAAFIVLESESGWSRRGGARPYGAIKGSGWSCDAHQATAPEPGGEQIERGMRECLRNSGCAPETVDCVLPHGTGTPLNDSVEMRILGKVFASVPGKPALTAIKSRLGHSGGASGAFSIATACLIMRHGRVPATVNVRNPEPAMPMRLQMAAPLEGEIANVLVNAYAFGGNNISVMVGKE